MEQGKEQLQDVAILLKVEFDEKVSDREERKDRGHSDKKIVSAILKMSEMKPLLRNRSVPDKDLMFVVGQAALADTQMS